MDEILKECSEILIMLLVTEESKLNYDVIKEKCSKMLIMFLATELELKLNDVFKENLLNWEKATQKERQQICCSILRYWLKQETKKEGK